MSNSNGPSAPWPADVIHVNEDGWLLINRGARHGVPAGLRLLVVGAGARELRDLFPAGAKGTTADEETEQETEQEGSQVEEPIVLRTRRTYELLEVVHVEPACAIAIAARTPAERRPQFYRGPQGELLVWVPLPPTFTYPKPDTGDEEEEETEQPEDQAQEGEADERAGAGAGIDVPPQRTDQEDERWEEALPLNGVGVGDQVVPAVPVGPDQPTMTSGANTSAGATTKQGQQAQPGASPLTPFEQGQSYDWMKPQS